MRFALLLLALTSGVACVVDTDLADSPELAELETIEQESATPVPVTPLADGELVTISATVGMRYFSVVVPADQDYFNVYRSGPSYVGADIYVRRGALPSTTSYDCRRLNGDSHNDCLFDLPVGGTYYILVRATSTGYTNMTLQTYSGNHYQPIANNYASYESWGIGQDRQYKLAVAGNSSVRFAIRQDVDPYYQGSVYLIVKRGGFATDTDHDCSVQISNYYVGGVDGSCSFTEQTGATYFVKLKTGRRYEATFTARYKPILVNTTN
jgi:hypothetical protein